MMFYSQKSNRKVVHNSNCPYFAKMDHRYAGNFKSIEEAREGGYHLCKHCAPMWNYYSKEYFKIKEYAANKGMVLDYFDGELIVQTPYSNWKIIVNGKKNYIFLYHKNIYSKYRDKNALVPGYHSQLVRRCTLMGYLEYIAEHDAYRLRHPEYEENLSDSNKGTTRNKCKTKKQKRREHYRSMMRIFALLENETNYRRMQALK